MNGGRITNLPKTPSYRPQFGNNHHAKETLMRIIGVRSRISAFLIAVVLPLQLSPALATGQPDAQQATIQGSPFPGMPVPSTETTPDRRHRPIEVTFTKWRTAVLPPSGVQTRSLFEGMVEGDLGAGDFVAEVLGRQASTPCTALDPPCTPGTTPPTITGSIAALHAIYEVQVGEHSFIALIQGGSTSLGGRLEGVIVSGWRIGARVSVAFDTLSSCTARDGVAHGPCFDGTIRVGRAPEK
jgi:hypothetical protein